MAWIWVDQVWTNMVKKKFKGDIVSVDSGLMERANFDYRYIYRHIYMDKKNIKTEHVRLYFSRYSDIIIKIC